MSIHAHFHTCRLISIAEGYPWSSSIFNFLTCILACLASLCVFMHGHVPVCGTPPDLHLPNHTATYIQSGGKSLKYNNSCKNQDNSIL